MFQGGKTLDQIGLFPVFPQFDGKHLGIVRREMYRDAIFEVTVLVKPLLSGLLEFSAERPRVFIIRRRNLRRRRLDDPDFEFVANVRPRYGILNLVGETFLILEMAALTTGRPVRNALATEIDP